MLNKKEIIAIVIITVILAFVISLIKSFELFLYTMLAVFLIIMVSTIAKKVASFYFESEIEVKIWEIRRAGIFYFLGFLPFVTTHPAQKVKPAFQIGAFLPIVVTVLTMGYVPWMVSLTFDVKAKVYRAAKRHGFYSFSEMTESHIGLIAAAGIAANLLFAIIGYLIGFPTFAKLNIYYAFFNMIPIGDLDGNKLFFGRFVLWCFMAAIVIVALILAIFVI